MAPRVRSLTKWCRQINSTRRSRSNASILSQSLFYTRVIKLLALWMLCFRNWYQLLIFLFWIWIRKTEFKLYYLNVCLLNIILIWVGVPNSFSIYLVTARSVIQFAIQNLTNSWRTLYLQLSMWTIIKVGWAQHVTPENKNLHT